MCAVTLAAGAVNTYADIYNADSTREATWYVVTSPDCIYVNGTRMVRIASYMKYVYGISPVWDAETKTVDFYCTDKDGQNAHMRVKVGSSYVNYSGFYADEYRIRTGTDKPDAFTTQPNQIIDGSVYVDECALLNYVMTTVYLRP